MMLMKQPVSIAAPQKKGLLWDIKKYRQIYLMLLPVLLYYVLFHYGPMYGAIIAFKNFSPGLGIWGSPWIGLDNFKRFVSGVYFERLINNTLSINMLSLVFGFPAPIILALLFNEMRAKRYRKMVQTASYLPHFVSIMVVCGIIIDFTSSKGIVNDIMAFFGAERKSLMLLPQMFKPIYVATDIWQEIGWNSIIFIAAMSSIDMQIYEAAIIDGAGRFKQALHVTLPGIAPTVVILLILRIGQMMNVGFEKIILLYNPSTYMTADVISSFVYREGMLNFSFSFSAAVGLFNSVINFALIIAANFICKRFTEISLW
jgi:putative aldouronate transport system permease protein